MLSNQDKENWNWRQSTGIESISYSSKIKHRRGAVVCPLPMDSLGQSKLEALFPGEESKWCTQREAVVDSASDNLDSLSSLYCSLFSFIDLV